MRFLILIGLLFISSASFADPDNNTFVKSTGNNVKATSTTWSASIKEKSKIQSLMVSFSTATDEIVTATIDSLLGATYDTTVFVDSTTNRKHVVFYPDGDLILDRGDDLIVNIQAGAGGEAYTIKVKGERL